MSAESRPSIRLAIAMNGGVSLAVWMGGVTQELDRLRRSGPDVTSPASPAWSRLTKALGKEVIIDLITGTSAGGLNGTLLGTAIGRRRPLPPLKDVWQQDGQLVRDKLLRADPRPSAANSVLDGDFFQRRIQAHLGAIGEGSAGPDSEDVTLLVTASALSGSSVAGRDMLDNQFTGGDHRRVYRFSSRSSACRWYAEDHPPQVPQPENDFVVRAPELSRAARASAGFPFAFEPVPETKQLAGLDVARATSNPAWLIDGGVLDNAPIGPLLRALRDRPRTDPGDRIVVYVMPSIAASDPHYPIDNGAPSPHWTVLPGRLLSLWRESDVRSDIEDLQNLSRLSRTGAQRPEDLINPTLSILDDADLQSAAALFPVYQRTRAAEVLGRAEAVVAGERLGGRAPDAAEAEAVLGLQLLATPTSMAPTRAGAWQWGIDVARRLALFLSRDARRQSEPLNAAVIDSLARCEWLLLKLQERIDRLEREALRGDPDVMQSLQAANGVLVTSGQLTEAYDVLAAAVATWAEARGLPDAELAWSRLLAVEVLLNATTWQETDTAPPFDFLMISPETRWDGTSLDAGPQGGPNGVQVEAPGDWASAKLYGTRFDHFGAFFEASWKDWDWTWGRLDGALALAEALAAKLPPDDRQTFDLIAFKNDLIAEVLAEEDAPDPATLQARTQALIRASRTDLLRDARDSHEADFDALLGDAERMISALPITSPKEPNPWSWVTARLANGAKRGAVAAVFWYVRRKLSHV